MPHNLQAQDSKNKYIDTTLIEDFAQKNATRNSLEYQEVWKSARKIFKKGKQINCQHLETIFRKNFFASQSIPEEKGITRYQLFSGSNGIIGQDIVLFINSEDEIIKIEIIGYGK
ncbi:MAG: hypothetical protein DWQ02_15575 [Bacteroidetes bacterium]|nr:MAG: hypothetical protein DWQ02_15575 [Bacteroidota bacterium]